MSKKENELEKDSEAIAESIPQGTKRREPSATEKVRRKINAQRDNRTVLGTCLPADIVLD